MNILDINIDDNINDIIDVFVEIYGEKYRNTIKKRISNILYVFYNDVKGVDNYHFFLSQCKKKELALKFLRQIGVDINKYETKNYTEDLDEDIEELLNNYFEGYSFGINPRFKDDPKGIKAFRPASVSDGKNSNKIKTNKIEFINFLRGKKVEKITEDTFDDFSKTGEYKSLLNKINEYLEIYDKILAEFEDYLKKIEPYKTYVDTETQRKDKILSKKRKELFEEIEMFLPDDIKEYLNSKCKNINEKCDMFLRGDIFGKSYVEYFADSNDDTTFYFRSSYLKIMGIEINPLEYLNGKSSDDFIQDESVKKLIPSIEIIKEITARRLEKYEEAQKEYIYNRQDFVKKVIPFNNSPYSINYIYELMKKQLVCMVNAYNDFGYLPILFYTVRSGEGGMLDYIMLHEICHCFETQNHILNNDIITGFDITNHSSLNPYDNQKRKYERLNENIVDIIAIEARRRLHKKGIYIFEPKEFIRTDVKNNNTKDITKQMLMPFLTKYREPVIEARLHGKREELFDIIGEDNFEELNDAINKVDYLVSQGLTKKVSDNQMEDELVIEYHLQLERVKRIYEKMDIYNVMNDVTSHIL
jgi:hypothetical protein